MQLKSEKSNEESYTLTLLSTSQSPTPLSFIGPALTDFGCFPERKIGKFFVLLWIIVIMTIKIAYSGSRIIYTCIYPNIF